MLFLVLSCFVFGDGLLSRAGGSGGIQRGNRRNRRREESSGRCGGAGRARAATKGCGAAGDAHNNAVPARARTVAAKGLGRFRRVNHLTAPS